MIQSPLKSTHLQDLLSLEAEYPEGFRLGTEVLEKKLINLEQSECSMSWILHDKSLCVAYVVAYPQFSRLQNQARTRVIYVDDIFVKRGYEACLFRLLKLFTDSARQLRMGGCPIEGVCRASAYGAFTRHATLLQRLGWELAAKSEYWDPVSKEEVCWLRWDSIQETVRELNFGDTVSTGVESSSEPLQRVLSLEDSAQFAYVPEYDLAATSEEPEDEFQQLTEIMIGKGDDGLVNVVPEPPVNPKELNDNLGIREFIGRSKQRKSQRILREDSD